MDVPGSREPGPAAPRQRRRALVGLVLGMVVGAIAWVVVQAVHPVFSVPEQYHIAGIGAPVERHQAFRAQQDIVDRRHVMLYLSGTGLLLGGALGLALFRSWSASALAAGKGLIGAGIGAFLAALFHVATRDQVTQDDLLYPFLRQLTLGVFAGAWLGQGLMLRRGWRMMGRGMLAGAIGGVLFAVLYTLLTALCLPEANTQALIPEEAVTRLVWLVCLAGAIGLAVGYGLGGDLLSREAASTPTPAAAG